MLSTSRPLLGITQNVFKQTSVSESLILHPPQLTNIQAFRQYASAAPTAAFAGQKGPNVSTPCILPEAIDKGI